MNKPLVKIACGIMTFLQLIGCAIAPTRTPPATIVINGEPSSIEPVLPDTMSYNCYRQKMAELKGKILVMHEGESEFEELASRAEALDSVQIEHESGNIENRNMAVRAGAIIPSIIVGGFALWTLSEAGGSGCPEANAIMGAAALALLVSLPLVAGTGALIGLIASGIATGRDLKKEHKEKLANLITAYNELNMPKNGTVAPDSNDQIR